MHDLVIRGGTLIDGTGSPARTADVAIDDGIITAVGKVGRGHREVQADGLMVTPGFVDFHTHYDGQATWDSDLTPSSWHGVTTVGMGNCGIGFAPAAPDRHDWLIGLMEGVEDIPGAALAEGIQWDWTSFPEYLDALERRPHAIDFGTQVPHGALRAFVMGERGAANEDATVEDIDEMRRLVADGLRAGALGFSTSRTSLHRAIDGRLMPGTFAAEIELMGISRALAEVGHGVYQVAPEHANVPGEMELYRALAQESGRPVMFNLSQFDQQPTLWKKGLEMLESARADGLPLCAQVAGRGIGIIMGWDLTAHPFATHPSGVRVRPMTPTARKEALRAPGFREQLLSEDPFHLGDFETFVTRSFHKMYVVDPKGVNYEPSAEESVAAIAQRTGRRPEEVAFDALAADDFTGLLYFPLFNYSDGNFDALHTLHSSSATRFGLSDAGAHCGAICDGGMVTFMLTHWTRDRQRGPKLPLEYIVKRQTRDTAHTYGLLDRGVVAPGLKADLNVIDYSALRLERPKVRYDLPAGGRRLVQRAKGYKMTLCSGVPILEDDTLTGQYPGRLIRGPQGSAIRR